MSDDQVLERKYARQNLDSCFKHIRSSVEASINDLEMTIGPILNLGEVKEYLMKSLHEGYETLIGQLSEGEDSDDR